MGRCIQQLPRFHGSLSARGGLQRLMLNVCREPSALSSNETVNAEEPALQNVANFPCRTLARLEMHMRLPDKAVPQWLTARDAPAQACQAGAPA
jgi:hypothetical protein